MELPQTFIPLPRTFDAKKLAEEALALPESAWMPHPQEYEGITAVPLVSAGGGDNNEFKGEMKPTPHLDKCPYHRQVIASFNEIVGRSRLMRIESGIDLPLHNDANYHWHSRVRIHVPVITHPNVMFHVGEDKLHMRAGSSWIFDTWQRHWVTNQSPVTRIHLVLDIAGSFRFWRMVQGMQKYNQHTDLDELGGKIDPVPFEEGKQVSLRTEKYNVTPLMSPGEVDAIVKDIINEFEGEPRNHPKAEQDYKRFLKEFAQEWRQVWLTYGYTEEGWPHYEFLRANLLKRIQQYPPVALTMKSSGFSANGTIFPRLVTESMDADFLKSLQQGSEQR